MPEEISMVDVIEEILNRNELQETSEEFFNKDIKGIEPRKIIIRDAAISIFQKKIPENKLVELLEKHLETSKETAQKIVSEIKQKLIPYAKVWEPTKEDLSYLKYKEHADLKEKFVHYKNKNEPAGEKPIEKPFDIAQGKEKIISPVDKEERKVKTVIPQEEQKRGPDDYREAIE